MESGVWEQKSTLQADFSSTVIASHERSLPMGVTAVSVGLHKTQVNEGIITQIG